MAKITSNKLEDIMKYGGILSEEKAEEIKKSPKIRYPNHSKP